MDKNALIELVQEHVDTSVIHVPSGDILFEEGEAGSEMFVIILGEVRLSIQGETLGTESEGGIVGEMSLIDGHARSATATTMTDCMLVAVNEHGFEKLVVQEPRFALHVMRVLAKRLRLANEILKQSD